MGTMAARSGLRRLARKAVLALVLSSALSACGDDPPRATSADGGSAHAESSPVAPGARHLEVSARSFAFGPSEITAKADEDLAIVLSSVDSEHDFTIDELGAHVAAEAGSTAIGGFRAITPGRYAFYCSVAGHRQAGMEGVLVVES